MGALAARGGSGVDQDAGLALLPQVDGLAPAVARGAGEAQRAEQGGDGFGVRCDQFGEGDPRGDDGRGRRGEADLLLEEAQGALGVDGRGAGVGLPEDVVEDLQGERTVVAGAQHVPHQPGHVEAALPGEAAVVAAPLEDVHGEPGRVGELEEEDLLAGDVLDAPRVAPPGEDVEAVQAGAERRMPGGLDDAPGVVVGADVPAPGERLVGDADAEVLGEVREPGELPGGEGVVVHGERGDAGADQHGAGAEPAHQLELVPGPAQGAGELLGGGGLHVPHRLVQVDGQAEVGAAVADLLRGEGAGQQVVLEDLHAVEPGPGGGVQLLGEGAAEGDGGDGRTHRGYLSTSVP